MDAGLAEYLSRMEAAVLAARGGMAKLSAENSQLRERVAELEAALRLKNAADKNKSVAVSRVGRKLCAPQHEAVTPAAADREAAVAALDPFEDLSAQIEDEMMQWSGASEEEEEEDASSDKDRDSESASRSDSSAPESETADSDAGPGTDSDAGPGTVSDAGPGTVPIHASPAARRGSPSFFGWHAELLGKTAGSAVASVFESTFDITEQQRKILFEKMIAQHSVTRLAIDIHAWLVDGMRSDRRERAGAEPCEVPAAAVRRAGAVLRFFEFLRLSKVVSAGHECAHEVAMADQLLSRLVDVTFSVCRAAHTARTDAAPFLLLAIGRLCHAPLKRQSVIYNVEGSLVDLDVNTEHSVPEKKEARKGIIETPSRELGISLMVSIISAVIVSMMPRRKTYLIGFLAEAICLAARTMNWGLALGIMRSTIELRNARIMPSGEPGFLLALRLVVQAILKDSCAPEAFASFVKIWESQLPLYAIQAASISKWVETTSSTLNSAALYVSGSILDRGRDILNSCSYCTCTKNMPSIDNSVLRWNRKTSFGRNNVQPIESALCPYCLLGLTLTAGWSEIGIWPSFQNLDCFGLENEENKRSGSILSCFGLGFVCDFSINIVQFLNFVVKLKSNQEVCDIGSFTSVHVRETVDLIYQFYSRNNVLAMQSSSNIHEVGQQIDEYFKTFWRNSISAECKIEEILSISHGWCLLNSCVRSILSEYDASGVGWRVGKVGKAENMDSRMAAYCDALRSALAAISTHVVVTPTETKDSNNLALENPFCFTSLSAIVSKSAILLLDTALKIISDKAKTESIGCAKLDSRYDVIVKHINNVAAIMSLMSYEQFLFLASRSALSFIAVLTETKISGNASISDNFLQSGLQCMSFLLTLPYPWGIRTNIEHIKTVIGFSKYCVLHSNKCDTEAIAAIGVTNLHSRRVVLSWILRLKTLSPVILINLNRRNDRLRRMEKLCDETGLVIARLPAVDGRFSETRNGKNCVIPECIVRQTWDSSVNATFDATCMTNSTVVMSASERACALSHAIVWLSIDEFFSRIDANRPVTQSAQVQALKAFTEIYFLSLGTTYQSWLENLRFCFHLSNFLISPSPSGLISKVDRNFYLVLEDDALIREKGSVASFAAFLRHITESLPLDCELCYLGYAANWQKQCDDSARYHKSDSSLFFEPTYLWQLHGYLLSRTGARKLLSHMPIDAPVDNFVAQLVYEKKIKCLALKEKAILQKGDVAAYQAGGASRRKAGDSDISHSATMQGYRAVGFSNVPKNKPKGVKLRKFK